MAVIEDHAVESLAGVIVEMMFPPRTTLPMILATAVAAEAMNERPRSARI